MTAPEVEHAQELDPRTQSCSRPFVHRWYELESFTAWERGRIIHQWRTEMKRRGLPRSQYSDAAWCRLVGGRCSPQHVGRLRRVFERFGDSHETYPGLYWSHFYAALDWDDAELWLQGAVENRWTVQQMQQQRSRALQQPPPPAPEEPEVFAWSFPVTESAEPDGPTQIEPQADASPEPAVSEAAQAVQAAESSPAEETAGAESEAGDEAEPGAPPARSKPVALGGAALPELPEDLIEPLEAFKLAVLHHKQTGWAQVSVQDVLQAVEHLRQFVLAVSAQR